MRSLHAGFIATGLLYLGALLLGQWLLGLPLEIYETFRIEERFGFNKTTPATFAGDQVKSLLLSAVLGGAVLAMVLGILQRGGPAAWLVAWAMASALLILMVYAAPALILPLFNKMTPLEDGELRREIMACADRLGFPLAEISVMDGSRRSTKANAFFTGIGGTKRVVLFDTLVKNHTTDELVAVLAHEIGHYKLRHIVQHIVAAILEYRDISLPRAMADRLAGALRGVWGQAAVDLRGAGAFPGAVRAVEQGAGDRARRAKPEARVRRRPFRRGGHWAAARAGRGAEEAIAE